MGDNKDDAGSPIHGHMDFEPGAETRTGPALAAPPSIPQLTRSTVAMILARGVRRAARVFNPTGAAH